MSISETKIDSSYPNAQFSIPGYSLYRNDRKKGGGGVTALASSLLTKKIVGAPGPKNVRFVHPTPQKRFDSGLFLFDISWRRPDSS